MTALNFFYELDSFLIIFLMAMVGLLIYKNKKSRLLDYVLALVLTSGISEILKYYINKPRPESVFVFEGSAFPSTHSATAACIVFFYLLVCHALPKNFKEVGEVFTKSLFTKDGVISLFVILIGSLVAFLRYVIGAHFPIDIFAGIILGLLISIIFMFYDVSGRRVK